MAHSASGRVALHVELRFEARAMPGQGGEPIPQRGFGGLRWRELMTSIGHSADLLLNFDRVLGPSLAVPTEESPDELREGAAKLLAERATA